MVRGPMSLIPSSHHHWDKTVLSCLCWRCEQNWWQDRTISKILRTTKNCWRRPPTLFTPRTKRDKTVLCCPCWRCELGITETSRLHTMWYRCVRCKCHLLSGLNNVAQNEILSCRKMPQEIQNPTTVNADFFLHKIVTPRHRFIWEISIWNGSDYEI